MIRHVDIDGTSQILLVSPGVHVAFGESGPCMSLAGCPAILLFHSFLPSPNFLTFFRFFAYFRLSQFFIKIAWLFLVCVCFTA